jgi:mono/diheme cytochrome c family protein
MRINRSHGMLAIACALWCTSARGEPPRDQRGETIFRERCASCHGPRGAKELDKGVPLSTRRLSRKQVGEMVASRLEAAPASDQEAVTNYIMKLLPKD